MADLNSQPSESDFDEVFVIALPEESEEDDEQTEIVYPVVSAEEAEAIFAES